MKETLTLTLILLHQHYPDLLLRLLQLHLPLVEEDMEVEVEDVLVVLLKPVAEEAVLALPFSVPLGDTNDSVGPLSAWYLWQPCRLAHS